MLSQSSRAMKPKLSLSINTSSTLSTPSTRPSLSLKSPVAAINHSLRSPISPSPVSPTARNTRLNQRGYSTLQQPSYSYVNQSSARSILKKASSSSSSSSSSSATSARGRQLSFDDKPMVYCVTPIDSEEYYGSSVRMGRDERRWGARR